METGDYRAPVHEMRFVLGALRALERLRAQDSRDLPDDETCSAILEEAARFAEHEIAPLNRLSDEAGVRFAEGRVRVPPEIVAAYRKFVDAGWPSLTAPPEHGGQGMPQVLGLPVAEMWRSANLAFALCPMLAQSGVEALHAHGSAEVKARFLPKLVSGEWTATMNLTEPQAGSDLAAVETRAERRGEGYRLRGRKIFITWGDHDLTDNIVHFVLARTAPLEAGNRGLSMFVAPKFLVREDGSLGERNDVAPVSIEHKLGIRGAPTCVMSYGDGNGAAAYLVGAEGQGLASMFTMMNRARLAVGVEGLGVAERAYQKARAYARTRVQGRSPSGERVPISRHPDVRRMLLLMKSATEAMRWVAYGTALELDAAQRESDPRAAARAADRVALLTPIVKGWCTELAQEVVSLGVQVHGGAGYIEETGAAQLLRDARVTTIYEGTTGIQALDLVRRKIAGDGGRAVFSLLEEIAGWCESHKVDAKLRPPVVQALAEAVRLADAAVRFVLDRQAEDSDLAGAASVNLLMLLGTVLGAFGHARAAYAAERLREAARGEANAAFLASKRASAVFYAEHVLPRARAYCASVLAGSDCITALDDALL